MRDVFNESMGDSLKQHETASAISGARLVGLDPNALTGFNFVESIKPWYDSDHGIYRYSTGTRGSQLHAGIYGY